MGFCLFSDDSLINNGNDAFWIVGSDTRPTLLENSKRLLELFS